MPHLHAYSTGQVQPAGHLASPWPECVVSLVYRLKTTPVRWGAVFTRWLVCFSQTLIGVHTVS